MTGSRITHITDNPELLARLIEFRTHHVVTKLRQGARILLDLPAVAAEEDHVAPADLEQAFEAWQELMPDDPALQQAVGSILSARLTISPATTPRTARRLGVAADQPPPADGAVSPDADAAATGQTADVTDPAALVDEVAAELTWRHYRRGETIYVQGDPAASLFVVVGGLVRVTRQIAPEDRVRVAELGQGSLLGERSLVLGENRSATAYAVQDADVCVLPLPALQRLVQRNPRVMITLLTEMAQRMEAIDRPGDVAQRGRVIALIPAVGGVEPFARRLAEELAHYGSTYLFTAERAQAELAEYGSFALDTIVDAYGFIDWMQQQARQHDHLLYLADADSPNWSRRVVEQADRILIVGRAGDSPVLSPIEILIGKLDHPELLPPQELVLLHDSENDNPGDTAAWLEKRAVVRHHHVALDSGKNTDRVGRFIRGRALGMAFGGGGMRAAACAGAARVLEEAGIRADVIGGTSAGSIATALYAMGYNVEEIARITREQLMQQKIWMQPTLPLTAIMSAQRLGAAYREVFGDVRMEDLWTTPFTISANLTQAKMVVHKTGLLRHAVRASTAIAGVLPPALTEEGELLIDGGVFNNTPADVARTFVDTGPVIAVDLGYTKRRSVAYDYGESLSGWKVFRRRINPFREKLEAPSIVDIMMRANGLGGITANAEQLAHADLILRPPVSDFGLYDFAAADDIVNAGYECAKEPIRQWIVAGGMEGNE